MEKTLGGDRLGSGKKMKVELHGYGRSTHDLGYLWRSTMSAGTLVPFMAEVALPGDTFDINLDVDVKTHPTIGPLFGSYKIQLDVFQIPMRLYNSLMHNNMLGIGMDMTQVKIPQILLTATPAPEITDADMDNAQINPSALLSYLGIRGIGWTETNAIRYFNAIPMLAYWDIYKNYYANKQELYGAFINIDLQEPQQTIDTITWGTDGNEIPKAPTVGTTPPLPTGTIININYTGLTPLS